MRNELLKHVILTHDDKDLSELVRDESNGKYQRLPTEFEMAIQK